MSKKTLSDSEFQFAELIWENEPIPSGELVTLCAERFGWKKSTTYTVLKHLCQYGYVKNEDAVVSAIVSREDYLGQQSNQFVEEHFGGSLSRFLTAFTGGGKLTREQADELKKMIQEVKE